MIFSMLICTDIDGNIILTLIKMLGKIVFRAIKIEIYE